MILNIPKRLGFFQELNTQPISSNWQNDIKFDRAYENSYLNSVIFDLNDNSNVLIKDGINF